MLRNNDCTERLLSQLVTAVQWRNLLVLLVICRRKPVSQRFCQWSTGQQKEPDQDNQCHTNERQDLLATLAFATPFLLLCPTKGIETPTC